MIGIYKITNNINNKVYIGQSINIENRWRQHELTQRSDSREDSVLYRAIRKYGINNFTFDVIMECEEWELDEWEIYFIEIYKSHVRYKKGYNMTFGGYGTRGRTYSKEARKRMGDSHRGKSLSEEHKENISKSGKGRKISDETKRKMREYSLSNKNHLRGKHLSQEHKIKISMGLNKTNKERQFTRVTCDGKIFNSISECSKFYNINYDELFNWLSGSGIMPIEWYDRGLRFLDKEIDIKIRKTMKKSKNAYQSKPVVCENYYFYCITDCANYYNVNPYTMRWWLSSNKINKTFIEKGLRYATEEDMKDHMIIDVLNEE